MISTECSVDRHLLALGGFLARVCFFLFERVFDFALCRLSSDLRTCVGLFSCRMLDSVMV